MSFYPHEQPVPPSDNQGGTPGGGINSFMEAAVGMHNAVKAGNLSITEEGGKALIQALDEYQQWYFGVRHKLDAAAQAPKLGSSNAAKVVSPYMEQVGKDAQGYVTQMKNLAEAIDKFREAIQAAMKAYKDTEATNTGIVKDSGT